MNSVKFSRGVSVRAIGRQREREAMSSPSCEATELTVPSRDKVDLKARWWSVPDPRGVVVVAHGLGEHGGAYAHLAQALGPALELDFLAIDFRGHGRSSGRRGVVRRYEDLLDDLRAAIAWAARHRPGLPVFLLGHSNGGQVALRLALQGEGRIAGIIASNPSIRIAMPVPPGKLRIGKFLLSWAPWVTLRTDAPSTWMTRDPIMQETYRADGLRHNRISAPLFFGMVKGGEMLLARAGEIMLPVLMLIGGQDPVINPIANREFYDRLGSPDKTFLLYPKMLHEPLNELGRGQVFDDLARWLEPRIA
jgi:alpha-beta hydrolase superfamily lysophospholipase